MEEGKLFSEEGKLFSEGDTIELMDAQGMGVPIGTLAEVQSEKYGVVYVRWQKGNHSQQDGGYNAYRFRPYKGSMEDTREYLSAVAR